MKHNVRLLLTLALLAPNFLGAKHVIMMHFAEYPSLSSKSEADLLNDKLKIHGKYAARRVSNEFQQGIVSGVLSTYFGFVDVSDLNGNTTYPREHEKPIINLIITPQISPVMMIAKTVHHWELEPGLEGQAFTVERLIDPTTNLPFWDVQEAQLPKNNRLPLNTIIILAEPKHVFVPTGITVTNSNPQLILPDIYVKKGISRVTGPLNTLNIKHFFGSVRYLRKTENTYYVGQIVT